MTREEFLTGMASADDDVVDLTSFTAEAAAMALEVEPHDKVLADKIRVLGRAFGDLGEYINRVYLKKT